MNDPTCLTDDDLFPLTAGEPLSEAQQQHFDACPNCQQRLAGLRAEIDTLRHSIREDTASSYFGTPAEPSTTTRPATIGKYLIVGELDHGGPSIVYVAVHPILNKELLIKKSLHPLPGGKMSQNLLVAEGKALAELDHPNIARIFDVDVDDQQPYLVMEYIRGTDLEQYVQRHHPSPQELARLLAKVARALEAAHRQGVVHQHVTPRTILIDEQGEPRLIDFGLARLQHGWDESSQSEEGTAGYLAPEQASGSRTAIGPASDVFALGGVLYFLLVSHAPFQGPNRDELLERVANCEFDREALRAPEVPPGLAAICLRAMAAQPDDRHVTAGEMAEDLEWFIRPRRLTLLAVLAAVVLISVAIGVWWGTRNTPPATPTPTAPAGPGR